ncbi:MAG: alkyl hydroperoxide reductase, partial [Myxococcales bacterium]|nr:alkyl hydroperoxide reductase [Myxococcales bacterium]
MSQIESLRERIPEPAKDIWLNLSSVLSSGSLSAEQRWGVAVASA